MNTKPMRLIVACGALLILVTAQGQVPEPTAKQAPVPAVPPAPGLATAGLQRTLTPEDLSAFLDGMLPSSMAIGDIAGAVVAVVKDDALLLTKAYGFANVEERTPVSADQTLFRPASISKLFAWTAVMQQVEAGRLDLDHDINEYLDFKISGYGGQPIQLRQLMTHTAGFEESLLDLLVDDPGKMQPLAVLMKEGVPARIYPPGAVPAYSNYGAALAGYIVQRVSGMPFEQYVEKRIFQPLRMNRSTFRQPPPAPLDAQVSNGYAEASGAVVPFEFSPDFPAGSLSATAPDMAQFMLAHLNAGLLPGGDESNRILKPATVQQMHSVANRPAPAIDAMAHGFYEQHRNGIRAIAHGGDLVAFHSELVLIPEAKVGLFVSFNSRGKDNFTYKVRNALFEGFMDRYFARRAEEARKPAPPETQARTRAAQGSYELSRRAETSLFSFVYMLGQQRASVKEDGTLELGGLTQPNGEPKRFREVEPWLWQEVAGESRLAALRNANGDVESLVPDGYGPIFIFQRAPAWRDKAWLQPAVIVSSLILVIALILWLVAFIRRRFMRVSGIDTGSDIRIRRISITAALLCCVFAALIGTIVVLFSGESFWVISSAGRPFVRLVQLLALLAVLAAVAAAFAATLSWRTPAERWPRSLGRSMVAAACLVWAYVAIAFHFLSLQLRY